MSALLPRFCLAQKVVVLRTALVFLCGGSRCNLVHPALCLDFTGVGALPKSSRAFSSSSFLNDILIASDTSEFRSDTSQSWWDRPSPDTPRLQQRCRLRLTKFCCYDIHLLESASRVLQQFSAGYAHENSDEAKHIKDKINFLLKKEKKREAMAILYSAGCKCVPQKPIFLEFTHRTFPLLFTPSPLHPLETPTSLPIFPHALLA